MHLHPLLLLLLEATDHAGGPDLRPAWRNAALHVHHARAAAALPLAHAATAAGHVLGLVVRDAGRLQRLYLLLTVVVDGDLVLARLLPDRLEAFLQYQHNNEKQEHQNYKQK